MGVRVKLVVHRNKLSNRRKLFLSLVNMQKVGRQGGFGAWPAVQLSACDASAPDCAARSRV